MKKVVLAVFAALLLINNSAQAASFNLKVAEDAKYIYTSSNISNYPDLIAGNYAMHDPVVTLLKFNIVDNKELFYELQNSIISSVKLNIFRFNTENNPSSNVYYLNDDSWTEGAFSSYHEATAPVYNESSFVGNLSMPPISPTGSPINQVWTEANLLTNLFNADKDGTFSLLIANSNYAPLEFGQDSIDQFLHRESFGGNFPSSLTIETTPTPEPSSMILGLMGLGSMLGFRKRK
jgi:hypothetical protein